jgi:hypothetical protein
VNGGYPFDGREFLSEIESTLDAIAELYKRVSVLLDEVDRALQASPEKRL